MPFEGKPYLIPFGGAGMVAHPNRWLSKPEELALAQNVTFENDFVQKEATVTQYDPVGIEFEQMTGSFSSNTNSVNTVLWFGVGGGGQFVTQAAQSEVNTASPWVVSLTGSIASPQVAVLAVGQDFAGDNPMCTTITDTKGNTWTRRITHPGSGGVVPPAVEMWTSQIVNTLSSGVD